MKQNFSFDYDVVDIDSLESKYRRVVDYAIEAKCNAYAPYSNFYVGAAAMLRNGDMFKGSNQESEVYPSGMCAERVLLYDVQQYMNTEDIDSIAVTAFPCGACRQVMLDTERRNNGKNIKVFVIQENKVYIFEKVLDLLPLAFKLE